MTVYRRREWIETLDKLYNPALGLYQTGVIRLTGAIKDLFYLSAHFPDVEMPTLLAEHFRGRVDVFAWYTSQSGLIYEYDKINASMNVVLDEVSSDGNAPPSGRDPLEGFKRSRNERIKHEGRRGGGEYANNPIDAISKVNELLVGRPDKHIVVLFHDIWWEFPNSTEGNRVWPHLRDWPKNCLGHHLVIFASEKPIAWTEKFGESKVTDLVISGPTPDEIKRRLVFEYLTQKEELFDWQVLDKLADYFSQTHQPPHKDYHAFVTQMLKQRQGRYYNSGFLDQNRALGGVDYRKIDVEGFKKYLQENIIGQNYAKQWAITEVERLQKRGVSAKRPKPKPIIRKLFAGPSGVGKTEIAKIIAKYVFQRDPLIIAGTEYQAGHEIAKLLGAPPGYVGHGTPGTLTRFIQESPYGLIILDEFEKAHEQMQLFFMNMLEEGVATTPDGIRLEFGNTAIIATSNTGSREIDENPGNETLMPEMRQQLYNQSIAQFYNQALLGRLGGTLIFERLDAEMRRQVAALSIKQFVVRAQDEDMVEFQVNADGMVEFQIDATEQFYASLLESCPITMGARIIQENVNKVLDAVLDYIIEYRDGIVMLDWVGDYPTVNNKELQIQL